MKKIFLTLAVLLIISISGYSQGKRGVLHTVTHRTDSFRFPLPSGALVQLLDSNYIVVLTEAGGPDSTLANTNHKKTKAVYAKYCSGCTMTSGLKLIADTIFIDTSFVSVAVTTLLGAKADTVTTISAGTGLSGGGSLSSNRTISADSTSWIATDYQVGAKADTVTTISAGTGLSGGGSLSSNRTISADSTSWLATDYQVGAKADTVTTISAGTGLSGGGSLSSNRTISADSTSWLATDYQVGAKADTVTTISAGTGLSGGGSLSSNRTISADSTSWLATNYDVDTTYAAIIANTDSIIDITWTNIIAEINAKTLKEGKYYRITDYVTTYAISGFDQTFHNGISEPLIVTALNDSTISDNAYSEKYPQDEIKYNVFDSILWAGMRDTNITGSIYFRHDKLLNNSTYYDYRNVKWRRWAIDSTVYKYNPLTIYNINNIAYNNDTLAICIKANTLNKPLSNDTNWQLVFDFKQNYYSINFSTKIKFPFYTYIKDPMTQVSLDTNSYFDYYTFPDTNIVFGNRFGKNCTDNVLIGRDFNCSNVFGDNCVNNTFENNNNNNTFGNNNLNNMWGNNNQNNVLGDANNRNIWGNGNIYNIWGNKNHDNVWKNSQISNTWRDENNTNTWGDNNIYNTWGDVNFSNTWGDNNNSNTWGDNNGYNTWGNGNGTNTWGNDNYSNTWGDSNGSNTWGDHNGYNTWGDYNMSNTWGYDNSYNMWGNYNYYNTWGDNNSSNTWGDNNQNNACNDINSGNTWGENNNYNTWGDNNDRNTWGDNNDRNTWGDGNVSNTWSNDNKDNIWGSTNEDNTWDNNNTSVTWTDANESNMQLKNYVTNQNDSFIRQIKVDSLMTQGTLYTDGELTHNLTYAYMQFADSNYVFSPRTDTFDIVTNAIDSLFAKTDLNNISYSGDTLFLSKGNKYFVQYDITFNNALSGNDSLEFAIVKDSATVVHKTLFKTSTTGTWTISLQGLISGTAGTKVWLAVTNRTDTSQIYLIGGSCYIRREF